MKLSDIGKRLLGAVTTAGAALAIISCGASNTVDFVYVTSNLQNPGQINAYYLDSESGALHQIADSPYPSGGRNPVYAVTSPDGKSLYVANHDDNTIVRFDIGTDGKLYPLQTMNTPGTEPVAMAINAAGTNLYVLDYYAPAAEGQPSYTDLNPGPGAVIAYPIDVSTGAIGDPLVSGTANYFEVQCFPSNLAVTPAGDALFVTNPNAVITTTSPPVTGTVPTLPATCPALGTVSGFSLDSSGIPTSIGTLSTVAGAQPVVAITGAGSEPTGIAAAPGGGSIYVTDALLNQVYTFAISGSTLSLASTTATGTMPMDALATAGGFLYVSNYKSGAISSYSTSSGVPVLLASTSSGASGPLCMLLDPDLGRFLYATNYVGGTVGGAELNPTTGALSINQGSPYSTSGQPTCMAAAKHTQGNTSGQ